MIGQKYKVLPGSGIRIKKSGSCKFNKLYSEAKKMFDEYSYDFIEKEHTAKDLPQGRENVIRWEAERKVDDYAKFEIRVTFFIENLREVNNTYEGKFDIKIFANITFDYMNKWQGNVIKEFMFKFYNEYIMKDKILGSYEPKILSEIEVLKEIIRKYIK